MCSERRLRTVMAVEWSVTLREAKLLMSVLRMLLMMGMRAMCMRGTILANACSA